LRFELPAGSGLSFKTLELETANWDALLADRDVIHHYAWSTIPQTAIEDPLADLDTNVRPTLRLLETMRRYRGKRLIFASSGGTVYGKVLPKPVSEEHRVQGVLHCLPSPTHGGSRSGNCGGNSSSHAPAFSALFSIWWCTRVARTAEDWPRSLAADG
jgi:nucleoside-diphosphate-sugar epimerase